METEKQTPVCLTLWLWCREAHLQMIAGGCIGASLILALAQANSFQWYGHWLPPVLWSPLVVLVITMGFNLRVSHGRVLSYRWRWFAIPLSARRSLGETGGTLLWAQFGSWQYRVNYRVAGGVVATLPGVFARNAFGFARLDHYLLSVNMRLGMDLSPYEPV